MADRLGGLRCMGVPSFCKFMRPNHQAGNVSKPPSIIRFLFSKRCPFRSSGYKLLTAGQSIHYCIIYSGGCNSHELAFVLVRSLNSVLAIHICIVSVGFKED